MQRPGVLLKKWRGERTQGAVAALLGIIQSRVSRLENGVDGQPGIDLALRIAAVTGGAVPVEAWATPTPRPRSARSNRRARAHGQRV